MLGAILKTLAGVLFGTAVVKVFAGDDAPPIKQGTFGVYTPQGGGPPGSEVTALQASEEIGPNGETVDWPIFSLDAGEQQRLVVDVALTVYTGLNRYHGQAGRQWCEGLRIEATATRSATGVTLSDVSTTPNAEACTAQLDADAQALSGPFPNGGAYGDLRPKAELAVVGTGVVLRVKAAKIPFADVHIEAGKGYPTAYIDEHVGVWRYTLRLAGKLTASAA
jgi:hypothetical protein